MCWTLSASSSFCCDRQLPAALRDLPRAPGTYALLVHVAQEKDIGVGRLGATRFAAGFYVYVGSGLGPGGLAARLARHLGARRKPSWHIDYLLNEVPVIDVIWDCSGKRLECTWMRVLLEIPVIEVAVPGFGASDCQCPAHLAFLGASHYGRWNTLRVRLTNERGD